MRIRLFWLAIFLSITVAAFLFYKNTQAPITYGLAPAFDGNDYTHIYQYFVGLEENYKVPFPFNGRILVPWLAAQIDSGNMIQDFQWVNLFFTLASIIALFVLWRQMGFELKWFLAGFFWLLFHWTGIIRLNAFDPVTVDLPLYLFQALLLLIILKRKFVWLLILAPLATAQKESFLALVIILTVYGIWHNRRTEEGYYPIPILISAVALSLITKFSIVHNFPPIEEGKGAIITLLYHAKEAILHPFEIVRWLVAMFVAFGPALFLAGRKYVLTNRYDNTRNMLLIFTLTYLAFGILAGGDMTRIIYLGFPFIATWIMYELREMRTKPLLILGLLSLPLMMLHQHLPDPAFQMELWESWYPEFANTTIVLMYLAYGGIATLIAHRFNQAAPTELKT
ncbi:hypothetical protein [Roseivirga seohaensis]|uniref:hypothetical protein n=1 Tax=Roseivirga seohaensis TaxID=1914963 RepID=UPI003BA86196